MPNEIGRHLLGRIPSPPDSRDWSLSELKEAATFDEALLEETIRTVAAEEDGPFRTYASTILFLRWLRKNGYAPSPFGPKPPPEYQNRWWDDALVLDQGDTPHCVGFTGADFMNAEPTPATYANDYGHELYYACKVEDGEPGAEVGSYVRSLMKVMTDRLHIAAYAALSTIAEIDEALRHGMVCVGTDWYDGFFQPDAEGRIKITGSNAGGHAYSIEGDDVDDYLLLNHWGDWGGSSDGKLPSGRAIISKKEFGKLLSDQGEAWATVQLA